MENINNDLKKNKKKRFIKKKDKLWQVAEKTEVMKGRGGGRIFLCNQ